MTHSKISNTEALENKIKTLRTALFEVRKLARPNPVDNSIYLVATKALSDTQDEELDTMATVIIRGLVTAGYLDGWFRGGRELADDIAKQTLIRHIGSLSGVKAISENIAEDSHTWLLKDGSVIERIQSAYYTKTTEQVKQLSGDECECENLGSQCDNCDGGE